MDALHICEGTVHVQFFFHCKKLDEKRCYYQNTAYYIGSKIINPKTDSVQSLYEMLSCSDFRQPEQRTRLLIVIVKSSEGKWFSLSFAGGQLRIFCSQPFRQHGMI